MFNISDFNLIEHIFMFLSYSWLTASSLNSFLPTELAYYGEWEYIYIAIIRFYRIFSTTIYLCLGLVHFLFVAGLLSC